MTQTPRDRPADPFDLAALLSACALACAGKDAEGREETLAALLSLSGAALNAAQQAVFVSNAHDSSDLECVAGHDAPVLRRAAQACLEDSPGKREQQHAQAVCLTRNGQTLGAWAAVLPGAEDAVRWNSVAAALAPFFALAVQRVREFQELAEASAQVETARREVEAAQEQVERRIREIATVYEVGQAMDRVEIDRLLDMITEKATRVMESQACSLLLKVPETGAFLIAASFGLPEEIVEHTRIFVGEGIAGRVAQTGEPLRLDALEDDDRFAGSNMSRIPGITSSLCMPMKDETGAVQGILCIRRQTPSPCFTDEDLRLFSIFATQVSLAVNNAQLYAKLNHKLQELSTLAALTETISSTLDLDQVLNQVADNIVDVVHFDRCRIYLRDLDTGQFAPRIVRGFSGSGSPASEDDKNAPVSHAMPMSQAVMELVAERQIPILVDNLDNTLPALREYGQSLGMETFYAQPIVARGRCIGVLVVSSGSGRAISAGSIELLSTFVHQAGIAIENARFYESQERRFAELTTLYEVSSTLSATSGVQEAAHAVNALAVQITDSDTGILLLFDGPQEGLSAVNWRGAADENEPRLRALAKAASVPESVRALTVPRLLLAGADDALFGEAWEPVCQTFLLRHRAAALVPLIVNDAPVGFLLLGRQRGDYGPAALRLIAVASSQAAAVLANARSYERRIGQRELELSAMRELMQALRAATTLGEALSSILDIVASLVWSDQSALLTVDENGEMLTVQAARGEEAARLTGRTMPLQSDLLTARALRERAAVLDEGKKAPTGRAAPAGEPLRSRLALPLIVGDDLIGVLTMGSRVPGLYTEDNVKMLHLVASQAATIYQEMSSLRLLTRYTDNILRSIAAGVITVDKDGIIVTWNRRAEEIITLSAHEMVGRHYREFIQMLQVDTPMRDETMRMVELTALTGRVFTRNQLCYQTPQGDQTYVNLSAAQLKSEAGEYLGVVVVFEDVTHEIQMKEEVERISKLAETGQLAANIAHELRNPLSSIKGAAQILRNDLPPAYLKQHGEFLDIIVEEVNGLNRMTTEFLEFSRVTPPQMQEVSLNGLVSRLLQFMAAYLSAQDVTVVQALDDDLPPLHLDKPQIEQVVKNIVINAAQAMPHGGFLTVASRYFAASGTAELTFTDTGVGIVPDKMEKIWTPFFTTKTKGTGLGLAITRKIVTTHGGRLSVRSAPGEGCTFTLHLPIAPLPADMMPHSRAEMTDQRSDKPGGLAESRALYRVS